MKPTKRRQFKAGQKKSPKTKDIYSMRKIKKRKRVLRQGIIFLLLAVGILVLYQQRDAWLPKLETIGTRHQSRHGTISGDGNFPLYVYGGSKYQTGSADGKLLVLSDSYLHIYDPEGELLAARQHTYGSAMLQTAGIYALVYENGGTRFRLETAAKTHFEKNVTDPIVFGRVSQDGKIAIVTVSDTCACRLFVFNVKGQQIYERKCIEELTELAFRKDCEGCFAASIRAEGGVMQSVIHSFSFHDKEDLWTSKPLDTLAISVYNTSEGDVFVMGDTQSCFLTAGGALKSSYVYPDRLESGCFTERTAALLLSNSEKRTKTVVVLNGSANAPLVRTYEKDIRNLALVPERNAVLIQFRNMLELMGSDGAVIQDTPVADSCDGFLRIGNWMFLFGYDYIDRMEYSTVRQQEK